MTDEQIKFLVKNDAGEVKSMSFSITEHVSDLEQKAKAEFEINEYLKVFIKDENGGSLDPWDALTSLSEKYQNETFTIMENLEDKIFFDQNQQQENDISVVSEPVLDSKDHVLCGKTKFNICLKGITHVNGQISKPFSLVFVPRLEDKPIMELKTYFVLHVNSNNAKFEMKINGVAEVLDPEILNSDKIGLDPDLITTYWLSYDRENRTIKYGKGYAMTETTLMQQIFNEDSKYCMFFDLNHQNGKKMSILLYGSPESLKDVGEIHNEDKKAGLIHLEKLLTITDEPLTVNPPPLVIDAEEATLSLIAENKFMLSSMLPKECKDLYESIKNCDPFKDNVQLLEAVGHSIKTEGCSLNEKLKSKPYLRVTVGENKGWSPGVPYVLEFWPSGAESPVHNHGSVNGIVKVQVFILICI